MYKEPKYGAVLIDPAKAKNNPDPMPKTIASLRGML
jgi:hypothetical protein